MFLRSICLFAFTLMASSAFGQPSADKQKQFEEATADLPRMCREDVGNITSPFPDFRAFDLPFNWTAVKYADDTHVYVVKNARSFLVPDYADPTQSSFLLWTDKRGREPEIILMECPNEAGRAEIIASVERKKAERRALIAKKRDEAKINKEKRKAARKNRREAREGVQAFNIQIRNDRIRRANENSRDLRLMQRPLAQSILDRMTPMFKDCVTQSEKEDVLRTIMAAVAVQTQMRDLEWVHQIEQHFHPSPLTYSKLKTNYPDEIIPWLLSEIHDQIEQAENRVEGDQERADDMEIADLQVPERP